MLEDKQSGVVLEDNGSRVSRDAMVRALRIGGTAMSIGVFYQELLACLMDGWMDGWKVSCVKKL